MSWFTDLRDFHEKYSHHIADKPGFPSDEDLWELRLKLIVEESDELEEELLAAYEGDNSPERLAATAKEMCDLIYVIVGLGISFGIDLDKAWDEVHRSNMSKEVGLKNEFGKQLKGDSYSPADIKSVLGL